MQQIDKKLSTMAIRRKVFGSLDSLATMRVLASLFEHDLEFEFVAVDVEAGHNMEQTFLAMNPFGEIPIFQDGDLTLFESRTIMRYISHKYAAESNEQVYMTPYLQGVVATWIDVEDHRFNPPATLLINEYFKKTTNGEQMTTASRDVMQEIAEAEVKLGQVLDVYEERLAKSKYLGGDKFTSADLTHLPHLYRLKKTPVMKRFLDSRPHVNAWCNSLLSRPAWLKVVDMVEKNN